MQLCGSIKDIIGKLYPLNPKNWILRINVKNFSSAFFIVLIFPIKSALFLPRNIFQTIVAQWNKTPSKYLYSFKFKSESLRQPKTKEQEEDLTSQTLFVLKDMKIRFPGKSDAESLLLVEDVSIWHV